MQYRRYLDAYFSLFSSDASHYASREIPMTLFQIPQEDAVAVIQRAEAIIRKESNLLRLSAPIILVGDLHGQFLDLLRIFQKNGIPPAKKFLFLGDLVDRGDFSFDILFFLFLLKIFYPENIFFIRGNHEFESLSSSCGFLNEIIDKYEDMNLFPVFQSLFSVIPIAALINDKILCIHGGLGPNFTSISQINKIPRPLVEFGTNDCADDILWSDPSNTVDTYEPSIRGAGYFFGKSVVDEFCEANNIDVIIRGHECVMRGYEKFFDGKVITLFSASNSTGTVNNEAAVIVIKSDMTLNIKQYDPLPYLTRCDVFYTSKLRIMQPPAASGRSPRKLMRSPKASSGRDVAKILEGIHSDDENIATSSVKNLHHIWRPPLNAASIIAGKPSTSPIVTDRRCSVQPQLPSLKLQPIKKSTSPFERLPLTSKDPRKDNIIASASARSLGPAPIKRPESNRRQRKFPIYS